VLAGGRGSRLGRDKATLNFHGTPQVRWALALLARHCEHAYASVRDAAQAREDGFAGLPTLADAAGIEGPAAGLAAAFGFAPQRAWLLVGVDMPLLDDALLAELVASRDPRAVATAYRQPDGTPEPLCAIWEPAVGGRLGSSDAPSLRRVLEVSVVKWLTPADPLSLKSVNTAADAAAVKKLLEQRSLSGRRS